MSDQVLKRRQKVMGLLHTALALVQEAGDILLEPEPEETVTDITSRCTVLGQATAAKMILEPFRLEGAQVTLHAVPMTRKPGKG